MKTGGDFGVCYYKFTVTFSFTTLENYMKENSHAGGTIWKKIHTLEELHEGKFTHWRNYMKEIHTLEELREGKFTHWRNYMKENTHIRSHKRIQEHL
jgi:hypothetical protein